MKIQILTLGLALFGASFAFAAEPLPCEPLVPSAVDSGPVPSSALDVPAPAASPLEPLPCEPVAPIEPLAAPPVCVAEPLPCGPVAPIAAPPTCVTSRVVETARETGIDRVRTRRVARLRAVGRGGCCFGRCGLKRRGETRTSFEVRATRSETTGCVGGSCGF